MGPRRFGALAKLMNNLQFLKGPLLVAIESASDYAIPTLSKCAEVANLVYGLLWPFKRLSPFS